MMHCVEETKNQREVRKSLKALESSFRLEPAALYVSLLCILLYVPVSCQSLLESCDKLVLCSVHSSQLRNSPTQL